MCQRVGVCQLGHGLSGVLLTPLGQIFAEEQYGLLIGECLAAPLFDGVLNGAQRLGRERLGDNLVCPLKRVDAVDEVDGKIVGYVHVCTKTFIDPMVVSMDRHPVERIKTIHDLMTTVRGICYESGVNQVYFTAEGEDFIKFLEKKFDIELFTKEQLYKARA